MAAVSFWAGVSAWRSRRLPDGAVFLLALIAVSPLGMLAIEAGWTVTEVGRQPWIIHGVMRTKDAITPVPGLWVSLLSYSALYAMLGVVVAWLLAIQFRDSPPPAEIASTEERPH